jgi:aminocarboxymuconate-semialdehyde decarboxylase
MNIDVHAHYMPANCVDVVDPKGKNYDVIKIIRNAQGEETLMQAGGVVRNDKGQSKGPVAKKMCDLEQRIKDMDATEVDVQVISVAPPSAYYNLKPEDCLWFSKRQNEGIAKTVKEYPKRFVGVATVPLQAPEMAVAELNRAVTKLGFRGV